ADVGLTAGSAIEGDVAHDNVFRRNECGVCRRIDDDFAAGQPFADVIVGVTLQNESHALGHKRAEALARAAGEVNLDGVFGKSLSAPAPGDFAADDGADDAVDVADGQGGHHFFLSLDSRFAKLEQHGVVERLFQ